MAVFGGGGYNQRGHLGDGTTVNRPSPVKIMDNVASVTAQTGNGYAIKTDGSLWAWGFNVSGGVGDGTTTERHSPVKISGGSPSAATPPTPVPISVTVDGTAVNFTDQKPANIGGRVLVPVRGVFETLGFDVSWNNDLRQATLARANDTIVITTDSATFTTNGTSHTLDVPAQNIGGRTMIPLRAVLESVGYTLDWDEKNQTVIITTD